MPIAQIFEEKLNIYISREKSILLKIDHPFIMKLVKTLKDSFNIYFISEYIRGKELFEVIREIGILSNKQTKFFAASIILAIDYLHKRNIVYRDVKPENIIVSERVKWINLGLY
jgi:cGMP-dependent protein kinase